MTHEKRASLIKKLLYLMIATGVVTGVWFYPTGQEKVEGTKEDGKPIVVALSLVHHQRPRDLESQKLAAVLVNIQKKYGKQITVSQVEMTEAEKAKPTYVVMGFDKQEVFRFEGYWDQPIVEKKVEEILRGLERVGKDWRPEVKGMTRAGK